MNETAQTNYIRQCDVMEGMASLPDNSIDVIITSPPYNKAGYEGFLRKRHPSDSWKQRNVEYSGVASNDFMDEEDYQKWQIAFLNECHRVLKPDGSLFYNHKVRVAQHKASHPIEWLLKSPLIFRQQIVWDRKRGPAVAPIRYVPTTELVFWMTKERSQPRFNRKKDTLFHGEVWRFNAEPNANHPAPFPLELPDNILPNIGEGLVVLDPFMGTGTTAVSAIKNRCNYIGFEISEEYCEIAKRRIEKEIQKIEEGEDAWML